MNNSYQELLEQNTKFPQDGFKLVNNELFFNNISIRSLIDKYGTPFRISYLPKITQQINNSRTWFDKAMRKYNYLGKYEYCYCTKCSHYKHIISKTLESNVNLETSSAFDIDLILNLHKEQKIPKERIIIHNGFKTDEYLKRIVDLQKEGFTNSIVILDNLRELRRLEHWARNFDKRIKIGLRMAIREESKSSFNNSRLGIRSDELFDFFLANIKNNSKVELKMIHFFVDSGIKDHLYYWDEFRKALNLYIEIRKASNSLDSFNLGGGFPIQNQLKFEYNYELIIDKIVKNTKQLCEKEGVTEPNIFTEFGKYTVGESSAVIFQVLEQKRQNESENWYIIDNSLLNTIPDAWYLHEKFILLPINKWENEYHRVNIGGISCDQSDYYNSEDMNQEILLPKFLESDEEPLYIGFFHTGAYQDAVSGYGGVKHCLIPSPKHIIIDIDNNGNTFEYLFKDEPKKEEIFKTLGYE